MSETADEQTVPAEQGNLGGGNDVQASVPDFAVLPGGEPGEGGGTLSRRRTPLRGPRRTSGLSGGAWPGA